MKADHATIRLWSIRVLTLSFLTLLAACRYAKECVHSEGGNYGESTVDASRNFNFDNTVDYVIAGDANMAARGFSFPLCHGGFQPLLQIKDKSDFIRLFPAMCDKGVREELKRMKEEDGWGVRNWRGEMFGNGAFWRDNPEWEGADKRIHTVLITGEEFDKFYQKVYAKDKMNLAPRYRTDMAWVYAYFAAEDDSVYGRVDALGKDERKVRASIADRYRIMIFRRGQKPDEKPSEMYFCKPSPEEGVHGVVSEDGRVKFEVVHLGHEGSPWGWLEYTKDKTRGDKGYVRLKADTPWLEKYKAD